VSSSMMRIVSDILFLEPGAASTIGFLFVTVYRVSSGWVLAMPSLSAGEHRSHSPAPSQAHV